jgi:hypothetical protein
MVVHSVRFSAIAAIDKIGLHDERRIDSLLKANIKTHGV